MYSDVSTYHCCVMSFNDVISAVIAQPRSRLDEWSFHLHLEGFLYNLHSPLSKTLNFTLARPKLRLGLCLLAICSICVLCYSKGGVHICCHLVLICSLQIKCGASLSAQWNENIINKSSNVQPITKQHVPSPLCSCKLGVSQAGGAMWSSF